MAKSASPKRYAPTFSGLTLHCAGFFTPLYQRPKGYKSKFELPAFPNYPSLRTKRAKRLQIRNPLKLGWSCKWAIYPKPKLEKNLDMAIGTHHYKWVPADAETNYVYFNMLGLDGTVACWILTQVSASLKLALVCESIFYIFLIRNSSPCNFIT
jgi:hypothetical protein